MRIIPFVLLMSFSMFAHAFTAPCMTNPFSKQLEGLLQPIAIFGEPDRRTEEAYARENGMTQAEVEKRYAATGMLKCGPARLTANLVLTNNLILTSAHAFFDQKTCRKISNPKSCKFFVRNAIGTREFKIKGLESIGSNCPNNFEKTDDWAILRLTEDVAGVTPYSIDGKPSGAIDDNQKVVSINAVNLDLYTSGRKENDETKTIGNCTARKVYRTDGDPIYFSSDCDNSPGGSGGAILRTSDSIPVLTGITRGSTESEDQVKAGKKRGVANSGDFAEAKWAAYHIPIRGKLLNALLQSAQN